MSTDAVSLSPRVTPVLSTPLNDPITVSSDSPPSAANEGTPTSTPTAIPPKPGLKAALGDRENLRVLGQTLKEIADRLGEDASPQAVLAALKTMPMAIHGDSSYPIQAAHTATVESVLQSIGLKSPSNHFQLLGHGHAVADRALQHPLGNFGGGLSWPVPMSVGEQRRAREAATDFGRENPNAPHIGVSVGALEYLNSNQPLSGDALSDPAKALEHLISSPRGQALGREVQTRLGGVATDSSVNEYALSALHLLLDEPSITAPKRNHVAGFDLAQPLHWGQQAGAVREGLSEYLHKNHITSLGMANVGAYLLLARQAPELLIKDIPPQVTYGSPTWVSLAVAVAAIEAQSPGKVSNMTFAQVMFSAQSAILANREVTAQAQKSALVDWGVINGIIPRQTDDRYDAGDLDRLRTVFNAQLNATLGASGLLETEIPRRKDIALAQLKQRFGEGVPLEEKLLKVVDSKQPYAQPLYDPNRAPGGLFSMLDIAMSGLERYQWETKDSRILNAVQGKNLNLDVNKIFNERFEHAITSRKQGIGTTLKHLVAALPLADRENLEFGKLEFFQKNTYKLGLDFTSRQRYETDSKLWVKAAGKRGENVYEIDLKAGAIKQVPASELTTERPRQANTIYKTEPFKPKTVSEAALGKREQDSSSMPPASFSSARTQNLVDAFVEHLDIDSDDVKTYARGVTAFDKQKATEWNVTNFFLNLIPLKSAIENFSNGHYWEGATDLALDIFGFITAGAGAAAKATKAGAKAVGAVTKALKVAKVIGVAALPAFNPLDGVGDLVAGGSRWLGKGANLVRSTGADVINKLKGASGSYDLLKAASRQYDAAATGSFKAAGQNIDAGAVLQDGRWYAFDVDKMRPYGSPLVGFTPKTRAMDGALIAAPIQPGSGLNNRLFGEFKVPESTITGLSRNSQGVYVAADGHLSHIRHTDSTGKTAVYEVRQVSRTDDGVVQARIYHNNRQTPLLVQHLQGDQWQRLGARGGNPPSVASDLGPEIGRGQEGVIYESLDGKSVYKDFKTRESTTPPDYVIQECDCLNNYYGEGFATTMVENGRAYIKMGKLDGVDLSTVERRSLPPEARHMLDDALRSMEEKAIFHQDPQLKNFLYSARDKKIYPVDIQSLTPEDMIPGDGLYETEMRIYNSKKRDLRMRFYALIS